jgi:hypothetical protein
MAKNEPSAKPPIVQFWTQIVAAVSIIVASAFVVFRLDALGPQVDKLTSDVGDIKITLAKQDGNGEHIKELQARVRQLETDVTVLKARIGQ